MNKKRFYRMNKKNARKGEKIMRTFLAVNLATELREKVLEVQKSIKRANAAVKYVEPENLHFTCKFFGEISEEKVEKISEIIREKISKYGPFEIDIKGTGVFPHPGYIRVIWLGLEDVQYFSQILKDFDAGFNKLGFKKEKSYIPHLTLGRVKGAKNKEALAEMIRKLKDVEVGPMMVTKIELKKSDLTPEGPVYTTVKEFKL